MRYKMLAAALALAVTFGAAGCTRENSPHGQSEQQNEPGGDDAGGGKSENGQQGSTKEKIEAAEMKDIQDIAGMIGKKVKDLGLDNSKKEYGIIETRKVLGEDAHVAFWQDDKNKENARIESIDVTLNNITYDVLYEAMKDLCGGPIGHGSEAYVASNGGAVFWCTFGIDKTAVTLKMASERTDLHLSFSASENSVKQEKLKLVQDKSNPGISTLPMQVLYSAKDYENGVLTVLISNQTGQTVDVNPTEYTVFKSEGGSYRSRDIMGFDVWPGDKVTLKDLEEYETKIDLRDYGQVTHGDYMIEMDGEEIYFTLKKQ